MEFKTSAKAITPDEFSELLEDIMAHAKSVFDNYDSKSDFSQGMALAYSDTLFGMRFYKYEHAQSVLIFSIDNSETASATAL